ncbi:SagB family peptide dehydrogenase [Streptomyces sp. NBC_01221]|uniref:SagB family peptide dehydrogenase n=1 Tax=unclassified Streptomyces TaxID=2593676 RepID=UPI002258ADFB|nr:MULTISPECIES: SagB family peptide dehydrogenase [unclassified Streptomyces]WSP59105.1 SagB family peptide dehydrogenase [Streptomyces sp. NBC_01241]WSU20373.1 SagB family peptide dehydrogenase [Streptomyces sp. NBC_01108]MCX4790846.1 SagB family peptide dehydrogenase [Streptomyces sp. NBC_01221]MCX4793424.1 SagB family peptide dehydrogenase [Streptomyces sp. NBC_01242]WSJ34859.1 SagB family peptide dehydrogenase [Streptomyces sp. NBC_01321]
MSEDRTQVVSDYVGSVFRRGREPMEPIGFSPDWEDQPSRHKTYLGVRRFPLPPGIGLPLAGAADVLFGEPPADQGPPWTIDSLAALLRLSYGVLDRRLRVSWNQDSHVRVLYPEALWGRGTASGGGMYPLEVYWVAGAGGPLTPGVYHYSTAHHSFERLLAGDLTDEVRAACESGAGAGAGLGEADGFLVVTVRFWKNSFKYNSFCYHVVTQDAGALLGSWELIARGMGRRVNRVLWFDDERLNRLLGLDTEEECALAVVPLSFGLPVERRTDSADPVDRGGLIDRPSFERSARTRTFEQIEQVHRAVLADRRERPEPAVARGLVPVARAGGEDVVLPEPLMDRLGPDVGETLRSRRTSFGSFTRSRPLRLDELATVLAGTVSGQRYFSDVVPEEIGLTGLYVLANRVSGLPSGTYRYDGSGHRLRVVSEMPLAEKLQRSYYLSNYNLEQVGAVLAISGRWRSTLDAYGSRGYRVLNSEVGAVAQTAYTAAAALGVGCGAVLGFDNIAIDEWAGLEDGDERTFLFVLLGHERADSADFDYRLD